MLSVVPILGCNRSLRLDFHKKCMFFGGFKEISFF